MTRDEARVYCQTQLEAAKRVAADVGITNSEYIAFLEVMDQVLEENSKYQGANSIQNIGLLVKDLTTQLDEAVKMASMAEKGLSQYVSTETTCVSRNFLDVSIPAYEKEAV